MEDWFWGIRSFREVILRRTHGGNDLPNRLLNDLLNLVRDRGASLVIRRRGFCGVGVL